ncbi:type I-E CRISPR-associated protein Cse1/CasA [Secundilactobacillus paracollinoides]|uniref:type I-E CRISPR-associated protein Cse1/CasA n=1 Tax=Secundilactobacillus paracollinoides TaxID=240427 RepID=UPI003F46DFE7
MATRSFNLTTEPWIKVIESATNQEKTVSLIEFFENAQDYQQLAGDMRSQDFVVFRLLLAILTTIYSRVDFNSDPYDWLELDQQFRVSGDVEQDDYQEDDLLATWQQLYENKKFSSAVKDYLIANQDQFDLFGDHPFYQVTEAEFDALVPDNKKVATGKGTVGLKQINRRISESGNTLAVFSPKTGNFKNHVPIDEFARWLVMYQNVSGVTDKTKIKTEASFSISTGWVYGLNPVFAKGATLFDTLILNLVLVPDADQYAVQRPVLEYNSVLDYVEDRKKELVPDNIAQLYTTWSRILHVDWQDDGQPVIFSAGIPSFDNKNVFIEPMTIWHRDPKAGYYTPLYRDIGALSMAMWRNFGLYVGVGDDDGIHEPGIVDWLHRLKDEGYVQQKQAITLSSINLLNDGNSASQTPAAEVDDDMQIEADVLLAKNPEEANYWPQQIDAVIKLTQQVGLDYRHFGADIAAIRGQKNSTFANDITAKFYERLNEPFKSWLRSLTNEDDRGQKVLEWEKQLNTIVFESKRRMISRAKIKDIRGAMVERPGRKDEIIYNNIFMAGNKLERNVYARLKLNKKG